MIADVISVSVTGFEMWRGACATSGISEAASQALCSFKLLVHGAAPGVVVQKFAQSFLQILPASPSSELLNPNHTSAADLKSFRVRHR